MVDVQFGSRRHDKFQTCRRRADVAGRLERFDEDEEGESEEGGGGCCSSEGVDCHCAENAPD